MRIKNSVRILHKHNCRFCYFQEKRYTCIELFDEMQSAAAQRSYTVAQSVIVKTCSYICFPIGQKKCQMFVLKLRNFLHSHNRMGFYPSHLVVLFPDFVVDTFLPR